ncbi:MAG: hypothetical protein A2309_02905 [Bacteroidetes bacterium RIFOXYB2_FULL_35_7]|nr:MAG: hypothetical protein A2309_02905 [Bacteroidetes bacterium RIFOXYB2_FULL_35_7]
MKDEECNTISLEKSKIVLDAENVKWMIVSVVGIILFISSLVYQWAVFPYQMSQMFATKMEVQEIKQDLKEIKNWIIEGKLIIRTKNE